MNTIRLDFNLNDEGEKVQFNYLMNFGKKWIVCSSFRGWLSFDKKDENHIKELMSHSILIKK